MPMPQLKKILIIWHWITCNEPSPARPYSFFQSSHFVAVFLSLWSVFLCPLRGIAVASVLPTIVWMEYIDLSSHILLHIPFSLHKKLYDFLFVLHSIYPTSPRVIINKRHKIVVTSNRCHFDKSPNIYVNIVKNLLGAMNHSVEFYLCLLFDDALLTKFQFAGLCTLQQIFLC